MTLTKEQLEERKKYIGASDAAAVLGLSRWRTPVEVWAEKTGQVPPNEAENIAAEVGNELEDYVARLFTRRTGKKVHRVNEAYAHKKYDFIRCHIDRKVEGESAVLQCKTCTEWKAREWEGEEIPLDYIIQECVEIACTGYEKAYICCLIGNRVPVIKEVKRNDEHINEIISKLAHFWTSYVVPCVMPQVITKSDGEVLYKLFPKADEGKEVMLGDKLDVLKESRDALYTDKAVLEGQIKKIENEIKAMIKDDEFGVGNIWKIRWKNMHKEPFTMPEQNYRQLFYSKVDKEG